MADDERTIAAEDRPILDSGRHPFELFVLVLGQVAGLPLLLSDPAPGSTTALLGPVLARVWGGMFAGGCLIALIGVLWAPIRRRMGRRVHAGTGLLCEQVGLVALGTGTLIYAIGLMVMPGPVSNRALPMALVGALGLAAFTRSWQIGSYIGQAISRQDR